MRGNKWDRRLQRADELAAAHPFAAEGLRFYAALAGFQKSLYEGLAPGNGALGGELDRSTLLPWFGPFLTLVQQIAPQPLAQSAAALSAAGGDRWGELLEEFWKEGAALDPVEGLLAWTFLQPYAEHLADQAGPLEVHATPSLCPRCGGLPLVGVLRPQGDGGKRSLICS